MAKCINSTCNNTIYSALHLGKQASNITIRTTTDLTKILTNYRRHDYDNDKSIIINNNIRYNSTSTSRQRRGLKGVPRSDLD